MVFQDTSSALVEREPIPRSERKRIDNRVPKEGDNGLYSQSWFPICISNDVKAGEVIGREFLGGRVVVFRGENGVAKVMSAYCPHLGADLACGSVVENRVQCAFHKWEYDQEGMCVRTGIGDTPPPGACLYNFPTRERFGIIWAFNGDEPLWDLMDFEKPDEDLAYEAFHTEDYTCDPWIFASNTPDIQHIKVLHGISFDKGDPFDLVTWDKWGFRMKMDAHHQGNEELHWNAGIRGSSTFIQEGTIDDFWMGVSAGFSMPCPGKHQVFLAICVEKGDGSPESEKLVKERIKYGIDLLARTAAEDKPILDTIRHRVGYLTKGDQILSRYFDLLRDYPRANPAADFIS